MQVGDLVKLKESDRFHNKIGVLWSMVGCEIPIARILWSDGKDGAMHIKFLEVVCK